MAQCPIWVPLKAGQDRYLARELTPCNTRRRQLRLTEIIKGAPPIAADLGGFLDFWIFFHSSENVHFLKFSLGILGPGRVCNGWGMAVGFKWTDSQPISIHLSPFPSIFMISVIFRGSEIDVPGTPFDIFFRLY